MTRDDIIETALQCGVWIQMAQGQERQTYIITNTSNATAAVWS